MTDVRILHPSLSAERRAEWRLMRDAMDGEAIVKARGETYLPMPDGFKNNPAIQDALYSRYKGYATFPAILAPTVAAMIGIIHGKEIKIEMPEAMMYLWEDADGNGLPLEAFHRRITRELIIIGAYAVLADAPEGGGNPFMTGYSRDTLINWDVDWWVTDESSIRREGFVWKQLEAYRVFQVGPTGYEQILFEAPNLAQGETIIVLGRGREALPRIPFAVGTAVDLSPRIEAPPLIGVANAAMAMYQLSADYRWQLYMSGQETLVAINGDAPERVGAGVVHVMHGGEGQTPELKYVSPTCSGIEAHRVAMAEQRELAVNAGARLIDTSRAQESGEARKMRFASETATLTSIAINSCALLERSLRNVAMLMGLGEAAEAAIIVTPPADLLDGTITPADAESLTRVWQAGGMSWETYYANMQRGGIASAERSADDEFRLIEGQPNDGGLTA